MARMWDKTRESGKSILIPPSVCSWKTFDWTFINNLTGWNLKEGKVNNLSPRILQHLGRVGNWFAKEGKWECSWVSWWEASGNRKGWWGTRGCGQYLWLELMIYELHSARQGWERIWDSETLWMKILQIREFIVVSKIASKGWKGLGKDKAWKEDWMQRK